MANARATRAAAIQDAIRQVLLRSWNPIGVDEEPEFRDEYDSFIGGAYRILTSGRSEEELIAYLFESEKALGMPCESPEQLRPVAQALLALDVRFDPHAA